MCRFFLEDLVAFKADPSILGTIEYTWTDPIQHDFEDSETCYLHKELPSEVRMAWMRERRLLPGFVIVEFMNACDGFCLVSEQSLRLVDHSLAVGDVVKRKPSDFQSGIVISTAIQCTLEPRCSLKDFQKVVDLNKISKFPNLKNTCMQCRKMPAADLLLAAPASELSSWEHYAVEDYVLYKDWIGQILGVSNDVTIRLTNGSVVTVEDPQSLDAPCFYEGSSSSHFVHRLRQMDFKSLHSRASRGNVQSRSLNGSCYPGQLVHTKKANLRLGRWLFGAYDPNIEPYGLVVDSPCMEMEVEWLFPNIFRERESHFAPPTLLNTDDINSGEILVYDRTKRPMECLSPQLKGSSYGPDIAYGHLVRFKDPARAALKYSRKAQGPSSQAPFNRIPRVATQGFDMNVFVVTQIKTQVLVEWQNGNTSSEDSTSLDSYLDPDDHDVWPGDKVSLLESEEHLNDNGLDYVRIYKIGVVQSVSEERIARVRWYEVSHISESSSFLSCKLWGPHISIEGRKCL